MIELFAQAWFGDLWRTPFVVTDPVNIKVPDIKNVSGVKNALDHKIIVLDIIGTS